jgi:hypothetical protein
MHLIEEIDQTSQLRSLETQQIVIFVIALDQVVETVRKFERKSVERVETFQGLGSSHRERIYLQDSAGSANWSRGGRGYIVAASAL